MMLRGVAAVADANRLAFGDDDRAA